MNGASVFATFEKSYFQFILICFFPNQFSPFPQFFNDSSLCACTCFFFCFYLTMISTCASIMNYSIMPPSQITAFQLFYISSIVFFSSVFFVWYKKYGSCLVLSWAQLENLQCYESNYKVVRLDINRSFRSAHELVSVNSCCHACAVTCKIVSKFL